MIRILGISGSLRRVSSNTALLRAAGILLGPMGAVFELEEGIGALPHFNPDLLEETAGAGHEPESVRAFRARLRAAEGILISSPEYAHGVPGMLKNALDWVVGSGEFSGKPVALLNASPRASIALASLAEIICTMDARLIEEAGVALPLLGKRLDAEGIVANGEMAAVLRVGLGKLVAAIAEWRVASGPETRKG